MVGSDQQLTKKLAEIKAYLERRIRQQEEEVSSLRSILEVVDSILAEKSFRPVEITPASQPIRHRESRPVSDIIPITTIDGTRIASMQVGASELHVKPEIGVFLESTSPPLRSFLVAKVLESMQAKDKEAAAGGTLAPESILSFNLEEEGGHLTAIHIQNFGDDRRLLELKNAIRWTFRRLHERVSESK